MNLCIDSQSALLHCQPESLDALIDRLEKNGYEPLVRKAAHHFASVFGGTADDIRNKTYQELAQGERDTNLQSASAITERELKAARSLENANVREVASLVRRSGVMLAKELLKQKAEQASDLIRYVDQLLQV